MNILTPPTDSIYKFSGIAGLAFFLYMGYYVLTPNANDEKRLKINEELHVLEVKTGVFLQELKYSPDLNKDTLNIHFLQKNVDVGTAEFAKHIYSLPYKYQNTYQSILLKRAELNEKKKTLEEKVDYEDSMLWFVLTIFYAVEAFCIWGMIRWYFESREQKHHESRLRQKEIFPTDDCQSCYKEFFFEDERGTNSDGTVSNYFCKDCYANGVYVEPDLTYAEAQIRLKTKLESLAYKPRRIKRLLKGFKNLDRWRRKTNW